MGYDERKMVREPRQDAGREMLTLSCLCSLLESDRGEVEGGGKEGPVERAEERKSIPKRHSRLRAGRQQRPQHVDLRVCWAFVSSLSSSSSPWAVTSRRHWEMSDKLSVSPGPSSSPYSQGLPVRQHLAVCSVPAASRGDTSVL